MLFKTREWRSRHVNPHRDQQIILIDHLLLVPQDGLVFDTWKLLYAVEY